MWRVDPRNSLYASIAAFVVSLAILATAAQPASAAFRDVAPTGTDAGNDCLTQSNPCATIQHAIDEAEGWDWVDVRAGTYTETVRIDKPLTLIGRTTVQDPGEPQTILDGGSGTAIRPESHDITIRNMTLTSDSAGTPVGTAGADVDKLRVQEDIISGGSSGVDLQAGGEEISVGYNLIEGVGDGIQLSGTSYSNLTIQWNRFAQPIGEYTVLAGSGTTIEGLQLEGNKMPAPTRIAAQITKRPGEESDLTENRFYSTGEPQLAIDGHDVRVMKNSFEGNGSAGCLQILGTQGGLAPSADVLVSRENEFIACNPYGIELGPGVDGVAIYGNEFPGSYDGVATSNASSWDVTGHVHINTNRFVGTTHLGIDNNAPGTLDAEQNWWGCNAGPGARGCDGASGGVDAVDPVTLSALIGPRKKETGVVELPTGHSITLNPGEQAEVAALLDAGGSGSPILGVPTQKDPIHFSSPLGTLNPAITSLQNGWTRAIFTAGAAAGQGWIAVSMDNQRTLVPVTIRGGATPAPPIETKRVSSPAHPHRCKRGRRLKRIKGRLRCVKIHHRKHRDHHRRAFHRLQPGRRSPSRRGRAASGSGSRRIDRPA